MSDTKYLGSSSGINQALYHQFMQLILSHPECNDHSNIKKSIITNVGTQVGLRPSALYKTILDGQYRASHGHYDMRSEIAYFESVKDTLPDVNDIPAMPPVASPRVASTAPSPVRESIPQKEPVIVAQPVVATTPTDIPQKDVSYVSWGNSNDLKKIIKSEIFMPVYISGMSGLGKSVMVKNICAELKRKYIRIQFSSETCTEDLIGGFRLVDSSTAWSDGPVITAMKNGAILLLDEIDRGGSSIIELQGIMEGEPYLIKKTGEMVYPQPGFNVIATGNTKGRGSDSGRYNFANVIDEAFLERFSVSFHQSFPDESTLSNILRTYITKNPMIFTKDPDRAMRFADELSAWGRIINETFEQEAIDDTISIRRMVHGLKTFAVFNNELKTVRMIVDRFEDSSKEAFIDLYRKVSKIENLSETD